MLGMDVYWPNSKGIAINLIIAAVCVTLYQMSGVTDHYNIYDHVQIFIVVFITAMFSDLGISVRKYHAKAFLTLLMMVTILLIITEIIRPYFSE